MPAHGPLELWLTGLDMHLPATPRAAHCKGPIGLRPGRIATAMPCREGHRAVRMHSPIDLDPECRPPSGGAAPCEPPSARIVRILMADDHPVIRQRLRQILLAEPALTVVAEAGNGDDALALARSTDWDVAVLDFSMPGCSGLNLIDHVRREYPQRPVLVLSVHGEQWHAPHVLRAGASGYLCKECATEQLAQAVRTVAAGGTYVSAPVAQRLAWPVRIESGAAPHERLSDREYRVMWLLGCGKRIVEIAHELHLRPSTVASYRHRALRKLELHDTAELVNYAVSHELVG